MNEKQCVGCKQTLPLSEFSVDRRNQDGLNKYCRGCKREFNRKYREQCRSRPPPDKTKIPDDHRRYMREYRRSHPKSREYDRQYSREYRRRHPENCKKTLARYRATINSCPGEITEQDIRDCLAYFGYECAYSGVPLSGGYHVDHIVPLSKHGSNNIHNIVPCLPVINLSKSAKDFESWYPEQSFYSEQRYQKIKEWMKKGEG